MVYFINNFFGFGKVIHNYSYNVYTSLSDFSVYLKYMWLWHWINAIIL